MNKSIGETAGALLLVGGLFYLIGFFPIWICRFCISLLGAFTGRWRTVGWPSLIEGALVGLMIAWIVSTPFRHARQAKESNQYDYEINGTSLSFKERPKEPQIHLKGTQDIKLFIIETKEGFTISTEPNKATNPSLEPDKVMVLDGKQVLAPKKKSTAVSEGILGMTILVLGTLSFLAGIGRDHDL